MPSWDAAQYLRFGDERTRPCEDLAGRIAVSAPSRVVDLGCGPGNSTDVLARRWPSAELTGLDSSEAMIGAARRAFPERRWILGDIEGWAAQGGEPFDVVFSNAALHWVADHGALYPRLFERAAPGGALAVQVPGNHDGPVHTILRDLAASARWRDRFAARAVRDSHVHNLDFYYDVLAPRAARLDLWATEYLHVMAGPEAIVEWYKGSGMRPYLDALGSEEAAGEFVGEVLERVRASFPPRPSGRTLFPFRRLFVVAYRA
jgi:trans-aconitate 2-methyltransferase